MTACDRVKHRAFAVVVSGAIVGCAIPSTQVVMANGYPASSSDTVYAGFWLNAAFDTPISPGASAASEPVVPTSGVPAYALLAPGFDPSSTGQPPALVALESIDNYAIDLNDTLVITVDDTTFVGDCATGHPLSQTEADLITERVFATQFAGLTYDAATCTSEGPP